IATVEAIRSQGSTERVALVRVAGLVAGREPALTLLRRAMRPGLGVRCSLDRLLDPVIPDRRGGIERTRDIGLADLGPEAGVHGMRGPHSGVAVGLQLGSDTLALGSLTAAARFQG